MKILMRVALRYGAISGVLAILTFVISFYMGKHPMMVSPYLDFRIVIIGVFAYFTLREIRDYHQGGTLFFSHAMIASSIITLVTCVIGSIGVFLLGSIDGEVVSQYISKMLEYYDTFDQTDIERIGKELYESNYKNFPNTNLKDIVGIYFGRGLAVGFFVSILLSVILRKQPKI
jgi:hypothetical protein